MRIACGIWALWDQRYGGTSESREFIVAVSILADGFAQLLGERRATGHGWSQIEGLRKLLC